MDKVHLSLNVYTKTTIKQQGLHGTADIFVYVCIKLCHVVFHPQEQLEKAVVYLLKAISFAKENQR